MTRSIFGWDLPPGVTPNDIEDAIGGDPEAGSVTSALAAILDDPCEGEESGLTGKPYALGEVHLTPEEAAEVIEEMRREVFGVPGGIERLAQASAAELELEVWYE